MPCSMRPRVFVHSVDGVTVITLADAQIITEDVLAEVGEQLDLIIGPGLSRVVINFREVRFMSSRLLSLLMKYSSRVAAAGGRLKLCGIAPELMAVFEIVSFGWRFDIYGEECSALDSF